MNLLERDASQALVIASGTHEWAIYERYQNSMHCHNTLCAAIGCIFCVILISIKFIEDENQMVYRPGNLGDYF